MIRAVLLAALSLATMAATSLAQSKPSGDCGEVVTIPTHDRTTTRYALARPTTPLPGEPIAIVLLPGGGGHLRDITARTNGVREQVTGGQPRRLRGAVAALLHRPGGRGRGRHRALHPRRNLLAHTTARRPAVALTMRAAGD
jgi:hypothetical protein